MILPDRLRLRFFWENSIFLLNSLYFILSSGSEGSCVILSGSRLAGMLIY